MLQSSGIASGICVISGMDRHYFEHQRGKQEVERCTRIEKKIKTFSGYMIWTIEQNSEMKHQLKKLYHENKDNEF